MIPEIHGFPERPVKTNWGSCGLHLASGISVVRKSTHTFLVVGEGCS